MALGTYTESFKSNNEVILLDHDQFILSFLLDMCEGANSEPLLKGTAPNYTDRAVVKFQVDSNLGDLNNENETQVLIAFHSLNGLNDIDNSKYSNNVAKAWSREYQILITMLKTPKNMEYLRRVVYYTQRALTSYRTGTNQSYTCTVPSGITYKSAYSLNKETNKPRLVDEGEDPNQPNYFTAILNILFNIYI